MLVDEKHIKKLIKKDFEVEFKKQKLLQNTKNKFFFLSVHFLLASS